MIRVLLLSIYIIATAGNTCKKQLSYHYLYGYGYQISCENVDLEEIMHISVYNEIQLALYNSNVSLNRTVFHNLHKIRELNISHSVITYTDQTALQSLEHLEKLTLVNDGLSEVDPSNLAGLGKLRKLELQHNLLSSFKKDTFKDLMSLKTLNLTYNAILDLKDLNLCELVNLERLSLSHNIINLINFDFGCLSNLEYLDISYNKLKSLDVISSFTLNELDAGYNSITSLNINNLTNLVRLNLEGNKLHRIVSSDIPNLVGLNYLNLGNNSINYIDETLRCDKLVELKLDYNKLEWINLRLPSLETLRLQKNKIKCITVGNVTHLSSLKSIDLSHNFINHIDADAFKSIHSLLSINLNGNRLSEINLNFQKRSLLKTINLGSNNITFITPNLFKYLINLKQLDLSANNIHTLNDTIFTPLENLENLNISYNKLTDLDYEIVDPLENLRVLDIEGNQLKSIDYSLIINELPNLDVINVKNNILSCEFLSKMIHYFKENEINYTINEKFQYDKENVAGIYCKETENKLESLQEARAAIMNNSKILTELYTISRNTNSSSGLNIYVFIAVIAFICAVALGAFMTYKYMLWNKRKHYIIDELELISNVIEPFKT